MRNTKIGAKMLCTAMAVLTAANMAVPMVHAADLTQGQFATNNKITASFSATNDNLGGELKVTIPDSLVLTAASKGADFTVTKQVSAKGRVNKGKTLTVAVSTTPTFTSGESASVTGSLKFGTAGSESWTDAVLLAAEKDTTGKGAGTTAATKDIVATVSNASVDYIGTYTSPVTFNIALQ